jgi:hypothetical protein
VVKGLSALPYLRRKVGHFSGLFTQKLPDFHCIDSSTLATNLFFECLAHDQSILSAAKKLVAQNITELLPMNPLPA